MRYLSWALVAWAVLCSLAIADTRVWTDKTGKFKVEAELVELRDGKVVLKKADGKLSTIPLERLSDEDQKFVQAQAAPAAKTAAPEPGVIRVELLALAVRKPIPDPAKKTDDNPMMFTGGMTGTDLTLLVTAAGRHIIGIDKNASRITRLADDKGTALLPGDERSSGVFSPMPSDGTADGRHCSVEIHTEALPVAGATKLIVAGELIVRCGEGESIVESEVFDLKTGGTITLNGTAVSIKQGGEQMGLPIFNKEGPMGMSVTLTAKAPLDMVKKLTFLTADGKEIEHRKTGSMSGGFIGQQEYSHSYGLTGKAPKLKLKAVVFERVEPVKVPLSIEAGVGF